MKVSVEELSEVKRKVLVELPEEQVRGELQKAYRRLNQKARIKGFRAGKVPLPILKRYYADQVHNEVGLQLINDTFSEALQQSTVAAISQREVDREPLQEGEPFRYSILIEVKPEIEVKDFRNLPVRRKRPRVSDEEVELQLQLRRQSAGYLRSLEQERPVQPGDHVILDFKSWVDGNPVPGGEASDFRLEVGANRFNADFETKLVGAKKGEPRELEVAFPSNHGNKSLAGKGVTFLVEVKDIRERVLPELDDDFARDLGDFENLDSLRAAIREQLQAQRQKEIDTEVRQQLADELIARNPFEIPEGLVEHELRNMLETIRYRLASQNLTLEQAGLDEETFKQQNRDRAEQRARSSLLLQQLAQQEGLQISDEELDEKLRRTGEDMQRPHEKVKEFYEENNLMEPLRRQLLEDKVFDFLLDQAEVREEDASGSEDKREGNP